MEIDAPSPARPAPLAWLPGKDPISALTHFLGFIAGVVGLFMLVGAARNPAQTASVAVYGATLVTVFLASTCYHFFDLGPRGNRVLRRFDHAAIFLFIAGTYVPVVTHLMDGTARVVALSVIGGLAVLGLVFKFTWFQAPRWVNAALYLGLGWIVVPFAPVMLPHFSPGQLVWLATGGVAYTVGAVVYARKRPDPFPGIFGFHEIWHLFVLAGAAAHYGLAYSLLSAQPAAF